MNFLQLAQSLRQECGVSGSGPATTVGQSGEARRLVDYVNSAWLEIQGMHDAWFFMRGAFSFQTAAGVGDYTPAAAGLTSHRYWFKDTLRTYRTALGIIDEQWLVEWEYQTFRNTYRFGLQTTQQGRPFVFAERPQDNAIMMGSVPDDIYTVVGEYQRRPEKLVADTDVPGIPENLHMVIVYKAMEYYGLFESAGEVLQRARVGFSSLRGQLEREQLPSVYLGNPLA
jgi:hypothetical protein